MPIIDVNEVLLSLDIAQQSFSVVRRQETVNNFGESVKGASVLGPFIGACQPLGDNSLLREEQFSTGKNGITVWTSFRLYSASRTTAGVTYQPDLIVFENDYYIVRLLDKWTQWGEGFVRAECIGYDFVQTTPDDPGGGGLDFSFNDILIPAVIK